MLHVIWEKISSFFVMSEEKETQQSFFSLGQIHLIGGLIEQRLRPPQGVSEAHLHLSYRPFVIRAIPSQTNGNVIILVFY